MNFIRKKIVSVLFVLIIATFISFRFKTETKIYSELYFEKIDSLKTSFIKLEKIITASEIKTEQQKLQIQDEINATRFNLKKVDFWLRYLEPVAHKKINGPLPVEWETEVFEKFEKPYKREGAGLTLAALYLEEENLKKDSLIKLISESLKALSTYKADSITKQLLKPEHFYFCNRLFLLNLATIYTTGFECPDAERIIPELKTILKATDQIYSAYQISFHEYALSTSYQTLYKQAISFVEGQSLNYEEFNHYAFIKDYVNPLFSLNQKLIQHYKLSSKSMLDYSLNNNATSIFSKNLYRAQNTKGIFLKVYDETILKEIEALGKLLFYDPILSGNQQRSCASCHQSEFYFTDTTAATALQFDRTNFLNRNTPSLINVQYNHLIMLDGAHLTLNNQLKAVVSNSIEMNETNDKALEKVLSCKDYKTRFKKLLKYTPIENEITFEHISSAIIYYYTQFGNYYSPFDLAMNQKQNLSEEEIKGFNLFMSKAECATCHFAPQFNGVKPPYVSSEFEVLGVPKEKDFKQLNNDKGRHNINPAKETMNAFRTGTLKNVARTKPYMHNGVFRNLEEVIDFYNAGGGAGKGLKVKNQTLSSDSLHLEKKEIKSLIAFLQSLNEEIPLDEKPFQLPLSKNKKYNHRRIGGDY